jgi:hypothetical protein
MKMGDKYMADEISMGEMISLVVLKNLIQHTTWSIQFSLTIFFCLYRELNVIFFKTFRTNNGCVVVLAKGNH